MRPWIMRHSPAATWMKRACDWYHGSLRRRSLRTEHRRASMRVSAATLVIMLAGCTLERVPSSPVLASVSAAVPQDLRLFILAGQSNMSGRGFVSQLPPSLRSPSHRVFVFGNDDRWRIASEPIDDPQGQIDRISKDQAAGVGPGLPFAVALAKRSSRPIGLIPCAKGGSSMTEWDRTLDRTALYGSCVARIRRASAAGQLSGLLWYQGETDARSATDTEKWPNRFRAFLTSVRSELQSPRLVAVVVGLADLPNSSQFPSSDFPGWRQLQRAQAAMKERDVLYVSAAGLSTNPDAIHLSTEGQLKLGRDMATLFLRHGCREQPDTSGVRAGQNAPWLRC
jgi:hypothetical protein